MKNICHMADIKMLSVIDKIIKMKIFEINKNNADVYSLSFSKDQDHLVIGYQNKVDFINLTSKDKIFEADTFSGRFAYNSDNLLAVPSQTKLNQKSVCIWDTVTRKMIKEINGTSNPLKFSRNNEILASNDYESSNMKLYYLHTDKIKDFSILDSDDRISFSTDNKYFSNIMHRGFEIFDIEEGKKIQTIMDIYSFSQAEFTPDGEYLAGVVLGDIDRTSWEEAGGIELFKVNHGKLELIKIEMKKTFEQRKLDYIGLIPETVAIGEISFSKDGKYLVSGNYSDEGTVKLWDWENKKMITILGTHYNGVNSIAISPDNKYVASGGYRSVIVFETGL
jgi:WD40 repeat protein